MRKYFRFMGAIWSIKEVEYERLQNDIQQMGYVPDVEKYGARQVKRGKGMILSIEPDHRRLGVQ